VTSIFQKLVIAIKREELLTVIETSIKVIVWRNDATASVSRKVYDCAVGCQRETFSAIAATHCEIPARRS
jgi:hypothetical protein